MSVTNVELTSHELLQHVAYVHVKEQAKSTG